MRISHNYVKDLINWGTDQCNSDITLQSPDPLARHTLVPQATPFAERGRVWSRCNQVVAMAEICCDFVDYIC